MTPTIESDRPLSVLIVDDVPDQADSLAAVLNIHGYGTRSAHNGEDALEAVAASPPDVVFMDIGMPGMDGCELARRVRAASVWKRPLMVAVSGQSDEADRTRTAEAGIDLHLAKPANPAVLVGVLERFRRVISC
jgi:CheY-like chemotaxis protein